MKKKYMPLYVAIKSDIINKIISGELKKDDKLPSERKLAKQLNVARITVIGALNELVNEGIIRKVHGVGSFINTEDVEEDYENIFSHITSQATHKITFALFSAPPLHKLMVDIFAGLFQLENPAIKVVVENITPIEDVEGDAFIQRLAEGNAPTVGEFFLHSEYASNDNLVPLEKLPGFKKLVASLRPNCAVFTANSKGDKHVHALTSMMNCRGILGNVDLMREAGIENICDKPDIKTLEEWIVIIGNYTKKNKPGYYGFSPSRPLGWHRVIGNLPYLWGSDGNKDNSLNGLIHMLKSSKCQAGIDFIKRLIEIGNPAPPQYGFELFAIGNIGLQLGYSPTPLLTDKTMSRKFEIKMFPVPDISSDMSAASVLGGTSLGIFKQAIKNDAELDAAWKWIKFLFRKKMQYMRSKATMDIPALKILQANKESDLGEWEVVKLLFNNSSPQFDFKNVREVMSILGVELNRCFDNKTTSKQCINNILEKINKMQEL